MGYRSGGKYRRQLAGYWPKVGQDRHNEPLLGFPRDLAVRWVDGKSEALDPQGATVSVDVKAQVFVDVAVGGLMRLGSFRDLEQGELTDFYQIVTFNKTGDLKNRRFQREAGLIRFRNLEGVRYQLEQHAGLIEATEGGQPQLLEDE